MLNDTLFQKQEHKAEASSWHNYKAKGLLLASIGLAAVVGILSMSKNPKVESLADYQPMTLFEKIHKENEDFAAFAASLDRIVAQELSDEVAERDPEEELYIENSNNALLNLLERRYPRDRQEPSQIFSTTLAGADDVEAATKGMEAVVSEFRSAIGDITGAGEIRELTKSLSTKLGTLNGDFEVRVPDTSKVFKRIGESTATTENSLVDVAAMARRLEYGAQKSLKYLNKGHILKKEFRMWKVSLIVLDKTFDDADAKLGEAENAFAATKTSMSGVVAQMDSLRRSVSDLKSRNNQAFLKYQKEQRAIAYGTCGGLTVVTMGLAAAPCFTAAAATLETKLNGYRTAVQELVSRIESSEGAFSNLQSKAKTIVTKTTLWHKRTSQYKSTVQNQATMFKALKEADGINLDNFLDYVEEKQDLADLSRDSGKLLAEILKKE